MVLKKVKLTYFDEKQCEIMQKKQWKSPIKHSDSVFLQWDCAENAKKTHKTREPKTQITQNFEKV